MSGTLNNTLKRWNSRQDSEKKRQIKRRNNKWEQVKWLMKHQVKEKEQYGRREILNNKRDSSWKKQNIRYKTKTWNIEWNNKWFSEWNKRNNEGNCKKRKEKKKKRDGKWNMGDDW